MFCPDSDTLINNNLTMMRKRIGHCCDVFAALELSVSGCGVT